MIQVSGCGFNVCCRSGRVYGIGARLDKKGAVRLASLYETDERGALLAGVPKRARHPNAGHLFAVFLVSLEAQTVWEKFNVQTSAFIPGTTAYKYARGKQMIYMNQNQAEKVDRLAREYGKILGFEK